MTPIRSLDAPEASIRRFAHLVRYYLAATALLPLGVAAGVLLARTTTTPAAEARP